MQDATRSRLVDVLIRLAVMTPGLVLIVMDNEASTGRQIAVVVVTLIYLAVSQYAVTKWLATRKVTVG